MSLWRTTIWSFLAVAMIIGCEPEEKIEPTSWPHIFYGPDSIVYHDIDPDTSCTSILNVYTAGWGEGYYTDPSDSTVSIQVDLNRDSILDFEVIESHVNQFIPNGPGSVHGTHNARFTYSVKALGASNFVSCTATGYLRPYAVGVDSVECGGHWKDEAYFAQSTFGYAGVRMSGKLGWIRFGNYGFDSTLVVLDHALNLSECNPIVAGQKE